MQQPIQYMPFYFPLWLRNQLISAGLKPVLGSNKKSSIESFYKQFLTKNKKKQSASFVSLGIRSFDLTKLVLYLFFFTFIPRRAVFQINTYSIYFLLKNLPPSFCSTSEIIREPLADTVILSSFSIPSRSSFSNLFGIRLLLSVVLADFLFKLELYV